MSESLWELSARELLARTASAAPTPGGGSIAAVTGAFGLGLVIMALEVTDDPALGSQLTGARSLLGELSAAADADVADFGTLMAAYGQPKDAAGRAEAITAATLVATRSPLSLVQNCGSGIRLADEVEALVKRDIRSDVVAGRDILRGAAAAALRTADINLRALERAKSPEAIDLRRRRDALADTVLMSPENPA